MIEQNKIKHFTSRTAALTYQTCKRKRFLANHFANHGLSPEAIDLFLETGTAIHRGLQNLLEHCRLEHPDGAFEEQCINQSVEVAINLFREDISKASISLREGESLFIDFIIAEHECLIEGLIRAFAIKRLPSLLEEYEILSVEMDEIFYEFSDIVNWQTKSDAEFLAFSDNTDSSNIWKHNKIPLGIVTCSIKSASEYAENTIRNLMTDMQGNSEWASAQARLLREFESYKEMRNGLSYEEILDLRKEHSSYTKYYEYCLNNDQKPKVYAVQYEHLITGSWKDDDKSGLRKRKSFIVHPYKLNVMGTMNVFNQVQTAAPTSYKWKPSAGRQPKGWERINIWEDIGVLNWVNMLAQGLIQPEEGNPLNEIIITSDLIFRDRDNGKQLQEWYESTKYQEEHIIKNLDILESHASWAAKNNNWKMYETALNQLFPKETLTCWSYYGRHCEFTKVCHEFYNINDLMDSNVYITRKPHHIPELEEFKKQGFIKDDK
jgi:hypothetical protein